MKQRRPVSGAQFRLRYADYEATIASVGASLRELRCAGRDLVVPFAADELRPAYRGATLAPWPNRVTDGRYHADGVDHQLPLTEPARGHALHGLVAWLDFTGGDDAAQASRGAGGDQVVLAATIEPQAGYPWRVAVETTYSLAHDGLTQTVALTNLAGRPVPAGVGPHPYLVAGRGSLDDWTLELPATRVLEVTEDRLVPTGLREVSVDPGRFDFRSPRRLGEVEIDHAFTGLSIDEAGRATVRLLAGDGRGVELSWDRACPWVQIHTADLPGRRAEDGHRRGLAVEPMTCGPDAFNAHGAEAAGLWTLAPGETRAASWRIQAVG